MNYFSVNMLFKIVVFSLLLSCSFGEKDMGMCSFKIPQDINWCYDMGGDFTDDEISCSEDFDDRKEMEHLACEKHLKIKVISVKPYRQIVEDLLEVMMKQCCGKCLNDSDSSREDIEPGEFADELNEEGFEPKYDIVYPVLGSIQSSEVFGRKFIPFIKIKSMMLITLRKSKSQIMKDLVSACVKLWPLLTVCILMAFVAGFFGWILDTWSNEDEFPRSFFPGVYEGFWWSFVSMTTVGYGDKAPRSTMARIFSVGWILVGITICSMFTASLTNAITESAIDKPIDIKGLKIGIFEDRVLDASFIVKEGGVVTTSEKDENILWNHLNSGIIDGIFMDLNSAYGIDNSFFDPKKYQITWKDFSAEEMAYGAIFKDVEVSGYFNSFMMENEMIFQTCVNLKKAIQKSEALQIDVFSPSSGLFWPFLYGTISAIVLLLCVGGLLEYSRKRKCSLKVEEKDSKCSSGESKIHIINQIEETLRRMKEKTA